jgi:DNA polymerase elongation subunit (family B)
MSKKEELQLAKRWFDTIPKNVYFSYIDNDELYIVINEDDEYHIQVSYAEVSYRAEQFAEIIKN